VNWRSAGPGPLPFPPFSDELDALDLGLGEGPPVIPEPATLALLGAGLAALVARRRRKR
jgi:hypothetical protein